jgi:hypothetical protein
MRGQDQLIPMEEGFSMNAMLEVAWHIVFIVRTVVKILIGLLFCVDLQTPRDNSLITQQEIGGSIDMGRLCYIDIR